MVTRLTTILTYKCNSGLKYGCKLRPTCTPKQKSILYTEKHAVVYIFMVDNYSPFKQAGVNRF